MLKSLHTNAHAQGVTMELLEMGCLKNDDILSCRTFRDMTWDVLELEQLGPRQAAPGVIHRQCGTVLCSQC